MQLIEEIYRARLKLLANEAGSQRALAERIGKSPAQISQWINGSKDSKTGRPRSMDRSTVREIELRFPKPEGWMDQPVVMEETGAQVGSRAAPLAGLAGIIDIDGLATWLTSQSAEQRAHIGVVLQELAKYPDSNLARSAATKALGGAVAPAPSPIPTWRDAAVELLTELHLERELVDPKTIVDHIDRVYSDRVAQARAKSARTEPVRA
ncbi:Helix-turn-helix [Roseateles sp. YR242]|uniref:helix-turn-helix domain-containing protein n=1 Tax=Roseateles sp. YR242 TaxID=1855305 RepID=UPI0008C1A3C7|nr:helix-turn-helix domain-containing protein [Roseateles sp. YR242]SEL13177.1 Helix-turn-helix [Roseateles sp. YR242]